MIFGVTEVLFQSASLGTVLFLDRLCFLLYSLLALSFCGLYLGGLIHGNALNAVDIM